MRASTGVAGRAEAAQSTLPSRQAPLGELYPKGYSLVLPPYDGRARARPAREAGEGGAESKNEMIRRFDLTSEGY